MSNPYLMPENSVVSFSGGRTSGFMLRKIIDAHRAANRPLPVVVFNNTGKEREETLAFVERCSIEWDVPVVWLEYRATPSGKFRKTDGKEQWNHTFVVVSYATASRNGEPYEMVIKTRTFLPNPVMRFCTGELKIKTTNRYVRFGLKWKEYDNAIGLRFDEPARVGKLLAVPRAPTTYIDLFGDEQENDDGVRDTHPPGEEPCCPLYDARATLEDVMAFWQEQRGGGQSLESWLALPKAKRPGWDLELRTDEGNCDLCFLKGADKVFRLITERPESAAWWIEQERKIDNPKHSGSDHFRSDRPGYAAMLQMTKDGACPLWKDEDLLPCHCTD